MRCERRVGSVCCIFFAFFGAPSGCTGVFCLSRLPIVGLEGGASAGVEVGDDAGTEVGDETISSSLSGISSSPLSVANG